MESKSTSNPAAAATTAQKSSSWIPEPISRFYSKFPLVVLPQETTEASRTQKVGKPVLWVSPPHPSDTSKWASSDPACLRVQLLFLLRGVDVGFREWVNRDAAPDGTLPALQLPTGELLSASEIRQWLDREHPLPEDVKELNGMPTQDAHTTALAYSHLVLQKLYPAYMAATAEESTSIHLPWPLNTFTFGSIEDLSPANSNNSAKSSSSSSTTTKGGIHLPPIIFNLFPDQLLYGFNAGTRGAHAYEVKKAIKDGVEGVAALGEFARTHVDEVRGSGWFLGAVRPSPLDALIASHVHLMLQLDPSSHLRRAAEKETELVEYVQRVMRSAEEKLRGE
ncbi:hypothetical protein QFC21_006178 [Naganishia friedmannii]|uniref:Uncharacterized protein n=1 Tax=Naganishia friedmannii TaxID=89922 RepID=A0ACC2V4Z5_9TREE|nr:hypothetical protein QFC21_006178 [Naganishia friedmannii]